MDNENLTRDHLASAGAIFALGALTVKELQVNGIVTLFINKEGEVEICPPWEVPLDGVTEEQALTTLLTRGYSDEQLSAYLKGREARLAPTNHE